MGTMVQGISLVLENGTLIWLAAVSITNKNWLASQNVNQFFCDMICWLILDGRLVSQSSLGFLKIFIVIGFLIFEVIEIIPVLLAGEAGTIFVDAFEFVVAHDLGMGIVHLQGAEQSDEGSALLGGTGVGRLPMLV